MYVINSRYTKALIDYFFVYMFQGGLLMGKTIRMN